jgi:uncharacterized protein (DUF2141 family)
MIKGKLAGVWMLIFVIGYPFASKAQNVEVTITEFRNTKGQIIIKVFEDSQSYRKDRALHVKTFPKSAVEKGQMTIQLNLAAGTYGLALIDDENSDNDMNYKPLGLPKEGFGFSNYYLTRLSKPAFDDIKFEVTHGQKQRIPIRIKYL